MSEFEVVAQALRSRRYARDVLDDKRDVYTRPWWEMVSTAPEINIDFVVEHFDPQTMTEVKFDKAWPFA